MENFLAKMEKDVWIKLQSFAYDRGLLAKLSEFYLENPDLNIKELDRQFRDEWTP